MAEHKLILATDLDGPFLGGSDESGARSYPALQAWDDALLSFVTGCDLGLIRELVAEPVMPHPDFVIGDVGITMVAGRDFQVVDKVQAPIARAWNGCG